MAEGQEETAFVVAAKAGDEEAPFVVEPKIYKLVWDDGEFKGLVIRTRSLPVGAWLKLAPSIPRLTELNATNLTVDDIELVLEPFRTLGEYLVSWNLKERVGDQLRDVPCTFDGLMAQEQGLIIAVLRAWMQATGSIPSPLGTDSPPGVLPPDLAELEASMAMTSLRPS